jgi:Bacterial DNA-binding protein
MTKNLKKGQRIGRTPKTGTELAISPRRVIVFKPSAILKQRINSHSPAASREQLQWFGSTGIRSGRCFSAPFG